MQIFTLVLFYLIGFVNVFGACYMMRHVFRHKIKSYVPFSLAAGLLTFLYGAVPFILDLGSATLDVYVQAAVYIPLIWLCLTDRSLRSLVVSCSGYVFTFCTCLVMTRPANLIVSLIEKHDGSVVQMYVAVLTGQLAAIWLIIFIGRLGSSRITEPMSIYNIIFVALLALFTSGLLNMSLADADGDAQASGQLLNAAGMSLLAVAFILISVVMTVKLTESRYYSTLNSINESYLGAQKDYYEMKQTSDTEIRRIRHDMKNHLICIRDLAAQGRYDELETYINEISEKVRDADRLIHTGSGIVDAIVNEKAALARKAHVNFEWEGTVSGLNISAVDSCTLVANLLDNALEACDKVDVAKRSISLSFRRSEHFLFMTCENSAARVVELADGRPISTKADKYNHGFGLENMIRCVEKYGGHLDLSSGIEDGQPVFRAEAVIPLDF